MWMLLSICPEPSGFPLTQTACVFWVRFQCFSIYDPVAFALDILPLLHSSYTQAQTPYHPCELFKPYQMSSLQFQSSDAASRMPSSHFCVHSFWQLLQVTHTQLTRVGKTHTHIYIEDSGLWVKFTAAYNKKNAAIPTIRGEKERMRKNNVW